RADIGAARRFRHPLPARPRACGIAARAVRYCTRDRSFMPRAQQRSRGTVTHCERTSVDIRRWMKQIDLCELVKTRIATVLRFIRNRDESALRRKRRGPLPQRRELYFVHTIAPCIPLREHGFVRAIAKLQTIQLTSCLFAHLDELGFDRAQ